jgi:hypothetical protein
VRDRADFVTNFAERPTRRYKVPEVRENQPRSDVIQQMRGVQFCEERRERRHLEKSNLGRYCFNNLALLEINRERRSRLNAD